MKLLLWHPSTVPVFLTGLWPSLSGNPESGTRVALLDKKGGEILLQGFSDESGYFQGELPNRWVGKQVYLVVREPGFKYDYFNPVMVERWGLFLAIWQEKDLVYNGTKGAKSLDQDRWANWNPAQEHLKASKVIASAVRQAKIAWPLREFGLAVAVVSSILGLVVSPIVGFMIGIVTFFAMEALAHVLSRRGY